MVLIFILLFVFAPLETGQAARSKIEWPTRSHVISTNQTPTVIAGIQKGFLGTKFYIKQFDARTTHLTGFIELSNLADTTNSVTLCLEGPTIAYHMELIDSKENMVYDPNGDLHNWIPNKYEFSPKEVKRVPINVRLNEIFDIKHSGTYKLLFIFDDRIFKELPPNAFPMKAWSRETITLRAE